MHKNIEILVYSNQTLRIEWTNKCLQGRAIKIGMNQVAISCSRTSKPTGFRCGPPRLRAIQNSEKVYGVIFSVSYAVQDDWAPVKSRSHRSRRRRGYLHVNNEEH